MARLEIRYDLRNPGAAGTTVAERYAAALEQIEWAERHGFRAVTLSEHHGTEDSYLPSPLVFGAAVAARTSRMAIRIAALVAPFHDPLRLAEDTAVLDQLSGGRLELVVANGYVASEFEMFGRELRDRVAAVEEVVATLRSAWTGRPFEYRGRTVTVTPRPCREPGPTLYLGGASEPAAQRAARIADLFLPSDPRYWEPYRRALVERGGPDLGPMPPIGPRFVHVAEDVERGWAEVEPYVVNDRNSYGAWATESGLHTGHREVSAQRGVRDDPEYRVLTPAQLLDLLGELGRHGTLALNPMMGGVPPEIAWRSLRLIETEVLPLLG